MLHSPGPALQPVMSVVCNEAIFRALELTAYGGPVGLVGLQEVTVVFITSEDLSSCSNICLGCISWSF